MLERRDEGRIIKWCGLLYSSGPCLFPGEDIYGWVTLTKIKFGDHGKSRMKLSSCVYSKSHYETDTGKTNELDHFE